MTLLAPGQLAWLAVLPVLWVLWLRSAVSLTGRGNQVLGALRLAAVALIVLALARPARLLPDPATKRSAVFLVDASLSIPPAEVARAKQLVEEAARAASAAGIAPKVVLFGRRPFALEGVEMWDVCASSADLAAARDGTDLEAALHEARAQVEPGEAARVFLFSDGNPTTGDLEAGVARMRRTQLPVYTSPLVPIDEPGVAITALEVPERAFSGDTIELVVRLESSRAGTGHLVVEREGATMWDHPVQLRAGGNALVVRSEEKKAGLIRFHARLDRLSIPDRWAQDNEAHGLCTVQPVPRVMIVAARRDPDDPFQAALKSQGIQHDVVTPPMFPLDAAGLTGYSCVVFDDVPAKNFRPGALFAAEQFNKEMGGGFIMLGGRDSFAAGGFAKTPVEDMLPVDLPTRSYSVSSGVVLLLDNSGSMTGRPLMVAKEASKALMRKLKGRMVGMWKFSSDCAEIFPPTLIGDDFSMIDGRIDPIVAEGGTQFQPPLNAAAAALEAANVENKYVILVSDGEPGDGAGLLELIDNMRRQGIKVSTIGIGYEVDPALMTEIARRGGGRYHQPASIDDLTRTFQDEVSHIVEGSPVIEEPFVPVILKQHAMLRGFKGALPTLGGYLGTTIKPRAELLIASDKGDPVLATWRHGLGVSVAWTPDVGGAWARAWVGWEGYARYWAQVVKGTFRANESDYALRSQIRGQKGELSVDAVDRHGNYLNFLPLFAQVTGPDGKVQRVDLPQRDPGRYASAFTAQDRGFYRIDVFRKDAEKPVAVGGAVMCASPEFVTRPLAAGTLARIAQETGGETIANAAALVAAVTGIPKVEGVRTRDLWPPLVIAALLLFFLEVALRRAGTFTPDLAEADGAAQALAMAESFLRMARDCDATNDRARAQDYYLRARSAFLKARREDEAKRMWERYRLLEERRGA